MLTRLRVSGFKNLVDIDVRFGPFTCVAGGNGVGKSNLFDAVLFLGSLADRSLLEAVTGVRGETRSADAMRVFSRWPGGSSTEMSFEAEMLVPREARDDLDQVAKASITFLRYKVAIGARAGDRSIPQLEVLEERLDYIKKGELTDALPFAKGKKAWQDSVFQGRRTSPLISTEKGPEGTFIRLHEDSGHQGRARLLKADGLTRTLLSTINTAENPTALVARREMQSWRLLQLEPSRLRAPDDMKAKDSLSPDGQGLPATLHRLLRSTDDPERVRVLLSNRLRELLEDAHDVRVDEDEKRELLTLVVKTSDELEFRARDLSDGTLRFLALAVLERDPSWSGLVCMEEPENGIHPTRIPAILGLLSDLAVDTGYPVDEGNPLRQVIINTHSPEVAALVPEGCLLFADNGPPSPIGARSLRFRPLQGTWRSDVEPVPRGLVLQFLNALPAAVQHAEEEGGAGTRAVATRSDLRQLVLPFQDTADETR